MLFIGIKRSASCFQSTHARSNRAASHPAAVIVRLDGQQGYGLRVRTVGSSGAKR